MSRLVRHAFSLLSWAALGVLAAGCLTADPMPSPGRPDGDRILVSSTSALRQSGPVELVGLIGLDGAVPGAGYVEIRQPSSEWIVVTRTSAEGSFAAVVPGAAGDQLRLTFRETPDGPASEEVSLSVIRYDATREEAPQTPDGLSAGDVLGEEPFVRVSAPNATAPDGGRSLVSGGNLVTGHVATIGNARSGFVVERTVGSDGLLEAEVPASVGDTLVVIVRSPDTSLTSQVVSLSVPAP